MVQDHVIGGALPRSHHGPKFTAKVTQTAQAHHTPSPLPFKTSTPDISATMSNAELASSYAALILADEGIEITVCLRRSDVSYSRDCASKDLSKWIVHSGMRWTIFSRVEKRSLLATRCCRL